MATTSFVVRKNKVNKEGKIPIYVQYCHDSKTMLVSTGERILPEHWNGKEGKLRKARKYPELDAIQEIIYQKKEAIDQLVRQVKLQQMEPSVDTVKSQLQSQNNRSKVDEKTSFFGLIDTFVEANQHNRAKSTLTVYHSTKQHLLAFEEKQGKKLAFSQMNRNFYDSFCQFLFQDLGMSINTVGKYIKILKVFLNYAEEQELEVNPAFHKFKVLVEESEIIYLTQPELALLAELNLSEDQRLEHCRDVFVFACYTGLRFSDVSQLKAEHISAKGIQLQTKKTRDRLQIPLIPQARVILDTYQGQFIKALPVISSQRMNEYLKELCEMAGIDTPVQISRNFGSKQLTETFPKHQLVSMHTARRTFITLSLEKGMRPEVLMQITGHKNFKTLMRYVKIVDRVKSDELMKAWGS
jgi:integrase